MNPGRVPFLDFDLPSRHRRGDGDSERNGIFAVTRTNSTDAALTVRLHPIAGTAEPGADKDYPLPETVTIPAGEASATIDRRTVLGVTAG